jgi:hypothetical protein
MKSEGFKDVVGGAVFRAQTGMRARDVRRAAREAQAEAFRQSRHEAEAAFKKYNLPEEWGSLEHIEPAEARSRVLSKLRKVQLLKHKGATEGERAAAAMALTRLKKIHKLRAILEGVLEFQEPRVIIVQNRPPSKTEVAKNIAVTGAALGGLGGAAYITKKHIIPAVETVRREAAPVAAEAREKIRKVSRDITESTAQIKKAMLNTQYATSHVGTLGRVWRNIVASHDPSVPGGAEYLMYPHLLRRDIHKAYQEGLTGPPGWGTELGRKARRLIKHYESLDDYIAFKQAEDEDNELVKRLRQTRLRRRSHGGGTREAKKYLSQCGVRSNVPVPGP